MSAPPVCAIVNRSELQILKDLERRVAGACLVCAGGTCYSIRFRSTSEKSHVGESKPNDGITASLRTQAFLVVVLRCVHGDCARVSFASCAGGAANRCCGRDAAKLAGGRSRARGLLAHAPAKLSPGSERHLAVSGEAREGAVLAAHARCKGCDGEIGR